MKGDQRVTPGVTAHLPLTETIVVVSLQIMLQISWQQLYTCYHGQKERIWWPKKVRATAHFAA
jgi:hypothetical protein